MLAPDRLVAGETVPQELAVQAAPPDSDKDQFTPLFCVSFCSVAVNICEAPVCTLDMVGDTATTIAGGGAEMVIVAVEALVLSATEVAVNVTVGGVGGAAGAV
jgi:hypothetical protein